MLLAFILL